jgi:hypothetical protein
MVDGNATAASDRTRSPVLGMNASTALMPSRHAKARKMAFHIQMPHCSNPFRGNGFLGGKRPVRGVFCWFLWAIRHSRRMKIISLRRALGVTNRPRLQRRREPDLVDTLSRAADHPFIAARGQHRRRRDRTPLWRAAQRRSAARWHRRRCGFGRLRATASKPLVRASGCWAFVLTNSRSPPFVKWKGALSLRDAPCELLSILRVDGSTPKIGRSELIDALPT